MKSTLISEISAISQIKKRCNIYEKQLIIIYLTRFQL